MCGIAGFVERSPRAVEALERTLLAMTDAVAHRGPDASGHLVDLATGVALGHRRLAIVDLSETGAQPMKSASGRYVVVFNGEIYGFREERERLAARGHRFRGGSDTEVLLAAAEEDGIDAALPRLNGMFAFALYDRERRRLTFARDRLGKKPLYIGVAAGCIAFGSELKAVRRHPAFARATLDPAATSAYLRFGAVPAPLSILRGVMKLPPGTFLTLDLAALPASVETCIAGCRPYWSLRETIATRAERPATLDELERVLQRAVATRMVADVPVGSFLSGGIDSSLVTCLMQEASAAPVETFTVRFEAQSHNEADASAAIAAHLGTRHHELTATPALALGTVDRLPHLFDEPLADPSGLPTFLVSALAREHVTVALSGDGGDESFAGYRRYGQMLGFERLARRVPRAAWSAVEALPLPLLERLVRLAGRGDELTADRVRKLCVVMKGRTFGERYDLFRSEFADPAAVAPGRSRGDGLVTDVSEPGLDALDHMMLADTLRYLVDDVLVKVDRASMAVGLEMRSPLLDHAVVETAWRLPRDGRMTAGGAGKAALRELLGRRLPATLWDRPKQGFGVPLDAWLRGELRDWATTLLSPETLARSDVLDAAVAGRYLAEHLSGARNWGSRLWTLLMLVAWAEVWLDPPAPPASSRKAARAERLMPA